MVLLSRPIVILHGDQHGFKPSQILSSNFPQSEITTQVVNANYFELLTQEILPKDCILVNLCSSVDTFAAPLLQLHEESGVPVSGASSNCSSDAFYTCGRHSRMREAVKENAVVSKRVLFAADQKNLEKLPAIDDLRPPLIIVPDRTDLSIDIISANVVENLEQAKEVIYKAQEPGIDVVVEEKLTAGCTFAVMICPNQEVYAVEIDRWPIDMSAVLQGFTSKKILTKAIINKALNSYAAKIFGLFQKSGHGMLFLHQAPNSTYFTFLGTVLGGNFIGEGLFKWILEAHGVNPVQMLDHCIASASKTTMTTAVRPHKLKAVSIAGAKGQFLTVATTNIHRGEVVSFLNRIPVSPQNTTYAITKGFGQFLDTIGFEESRLNHSCDPNLYLCFDDWTFRARTDIKENEELTFNYLHNEYEMASPFECLCGADDCFRFIAGFKALSRESQAKIVSQCSPWIKYQFFQNS